MTTPAASKHRHVSEKASRFTESVIREMTREAQRHGAVNLSQGFPDFPAPEDIKRAAVAAIEADVNQYAITWGARDFREAIAEKTRWHLGLDIDPETEITVTCGSTEGMIASMMATVDPGEEVVIFEPFYENYAPDTILSDARPRYVPLRAPDGLRPTSCARFNGAQGLIVCNPTTEGRFPQRGAEVIARLQEFDALASPTKSTRHPYPRQGPEVSTLDGANFGMPREHRRRNRCEDILVRDGGR